LHFVVGEEMKLLSMKDIFYQIVFEGRRVGEVEQRL